MSGVLYIFPSEAAVDAFTRQAVETTGVLLGAPALTLKRLADDIFRVSVEARRPISTVGRKLLLEEIVQERYRDGTGHFASLREFPGFIHALDALFTDLKQSLVDPDSYSTVIRRMPGNGRLVELASLYRAYGEGLARRGLIDRHDSETAALAHLRAGGPLPPQLEGKSALISSGIYDLTPLQLALLAALSRRLPVELRLPWNPEREALYSYVSRTADAVELLDNSDLQLEPVFDEPAGTYLTPLLAALHAEGGEGALRHEAPEGLLLMAAPGPYRECEEIGRRIRTLLEEGVDPTEIGVVFRELTAYGPMFEDVCRRYRIPVSYRRGATLVASPLVQACLAPFTAVLSRFGREELLSLVKSTYLDSSRLGVPPDIIEEVLIDAGYIDENLGTTDTVIGKRISFLKGLGKSTAREEAVRRALLSVINDVKSFRGEKTLREFTEVLEEFIERRLIYRRGIEAADPRALKRDASAILRFRQVLKDLEGDMRALGLADGRLPASAFVALMKQGMADVFLAGERSSGVAILNFHDARGLTFPHLFMGGLNEGVCPVRHDGHPLFKDSDKLRFRSISNAPLFRTAREKGAEEPLLFFLAIGCATKRLTLSYSHVDSRGNSLLRSPFLEELLMNVTLNETRIPVTNIIPEPAECLEREEILNALAAARRFSLPCEDAIPLRDSLDRIAAIAGIEVQRELFFQAENKTARAALSTPHTGTLRRDDIIAEMQAFYESGEGNRFAPTTLEEFGCCPFRYFLRRLLKIDPLEKPEMELAPKEEGSLVHDILQRLFSRLQVEGLLPLVDAASARAILHDEARQVFDRWERERYTGEPLLWEIGKGKILTLLERVVDMEAADDAGIVPELFEHSFDDLEVTDDDGSRIILTGKIDRVDRGEGRLRVVDYKLGGDRSTYQSYLKKEQLGKTSFQMPIYQLAAARGLAGGDDPPGDRFIARYWLLRRLDCVDRDFSDGKEDFTGFFSTDPEDRKVLGDDNFLNRLCGMVRTMKRGDFQITPKECEFCDYGSVCRYVEVGLQEAAE